MKDINNSSIPIIFITIASGLAIFFLWVYTNGYPYVYENSESYLSYIHAWFLNYDNPISFSFLTREDFNQVYTHNPNLPRYIHYFLMKLGVEDFVCQLLIIVTLTTMGAILLLYSALRYKIRDSLLILLAIVFFIFTPQFVLFSHNTYRVFSFLLFGMMMYSTFTRKTITMAISSFILFQFEYAFAIFIAATCLSFMLLDGLHKNKKAALFLLLGAAASIAVFAFQVISYQSFDKLINEMFYVTLPVRGMVNRDLGSMLSAFAYILDRDGGSCWIIYLSCLITVVSGATVFFILKKSKSNLVVKYEYLLSQIYFPAKLLVAVYIGGMTVVVLLAGYCINAYGDYRFPFICFHELAGFIFVATVISVFLQAVITNKYSQILIPIFLFGFLAYSISLQLERYKYYLPGGFVDINRGKYIDVFKKYSDKHLFTNFGAVSAFVSKPKPVNLAYGIDDLEAAIIRYNQRHNVDSEEKYYVCVQHLGFNCPNFISEILNKWDVSIIEQNKDYAVVKFSGNYITRLAMGVDDESWVELGLNLLNGTSIKNSLLNTMQVRVKLLNGETNPNPLDSRSKLMLRSFKAVEDIMWGVTMSSLQIEQHVIKELQDKYPTTWKAAIITSISKSVSESNSREFCIESDIEKAFEYINRFEK